MSTELRSDSPLVLGSHEFLSRLIVGTGKYATFELMRECLEASAADVITVAVRRERLVDAEGRNILDFIDLERYTILPNTAGCFNAEDDVRTARMGRDCLPMGSRVLPPGLLTYRDTSTAYLSDCLPIRADHSRWNLSRLYVVLELISGRV